MILAVITGESKGQEGTVLGSTEKFKTAVEGLNMIKKHVKPSANNPQGSIEELEGQSIYQPNVGCNGEATAQESVQMTKEN